ncbi:beta-glucoside-specific PTS transporter subunit IIABC [Bacillus sp. Au-Bac7]|uniref:beta-glucoside-specific PTS transporter subunit IIABC n=1 Tax=Bacillus sp. Au-Bac7 TaxID=2906458 RepID=UPI001E2DE7C7|nr:beta-glucoside-specific PTS transporter subunit IIABC [Bacillus sp. Au-Bac7]MCE4052186.1 beta-glucoside-specific PTS transporter subunit IIABC [Bacillus sp. Au-Bac7]
MSYNKLASAIIEQVGGAENVSNLTHCVTRLRFNLKNDELADTEKIKNIDGVVGCVNKGGQLQVIIGPHVKDVHDEVVKLGNMTSGEKGEPDGKKGFAKFFDIIAAIFIPIVGALAGSGMVKAILAVSTNFGWMTTDSQTYFILNIMGDAVFYFLPFLIAFTAAKKFNTSPLLALVFAGILLHPDLTALRVDGGEAAFLGIPIRLATYSSSVIPIILIVLLQSYVERFMQKYTPNVVKVFVVPMVTILIVAPIGLIALGPLGSILGDYLAIGFTFLDERASWLVPMLVGGLAPFLVMTGMHYSLGAVQATQRAAVGYGSILTPGTLSYNMAQAGAVLAVAVRTKNKKLKSLATSTGVSCLMGISEPALYGVTLQRKRTLAATVIGGAAAGLYAGITGIKTYSAGTSNIFSLPIYMGGDSMWSFYNAIFTVIVAIVVGFVVSIILFKEEDTAAKKESDTSSEDNESETIHAQINEKVQMYSPLNGIAMPLSKVEDDAFSTEAMGKGIAIDPTEGKVVSPFDGKVAMVFKTKHALGLVSNEGVEVLIHVGIDTVRLDGRFFESFVKEGDQIKKGDILLTFEADEMRKAGYDLTTPIIVTNTSQYLDIVEGQGGEVDNNTIILTAIK